MPKKRKELKGTVERIIRGMVGEPEKAQIGIDEADNLYREIRVPNEWTDDNGDRNPVKQGAEIHVTLEGADSDPTMQMPASHDGKRPKASVPKDSGHGK